MKRDFKTQERDELTENLHFSENSALNNLGVTEPKASGA